MKSIKAGVIAIAVTLSTSVSATVYYVSDCQTGAVATCIPGNDTNPGTSIDAPWQTTARVGVAMGSLAAGDEIRFARGGAFANARLRVFNLNSRAATPIVFDSYQPRWSTTVQKPILISTVDLDLFNFEDSGNADHDEGYVVRNLDLRGQGAGTGVSIYNDADYITLDSLDISNFAIGVNCSDSNPANPGSNARNDYITLKNSTIKNNKAQGYLGGCNQVLIENNRFDNNGFSGTLPRNHNIYIGSNGSNVTVRGNVLTRSAVGAGVCQGVALVVHNNQTGLIIENNTIDETTGAGPGCYGIQVNPGNGGLAEAFRGTIIRGNKVINVGGNGIAVGACPDCVIENNVIVQQVPRTFIGITMPSENIETGIDAADNNLMVRNNSMYIAGGTSDSVGIRVATYGSNHKVVSNLIYFGTGTNNAKCFGNSGLTLANFMAFDNNLCYSAGPIAYSQTYTTLAAAKSAGFDVHGFNIDPMLEALPSASNGYSMKGKPGSPLLNNGHPTLSVVPAPANIGAYVPQAVGGESLLTNQVPALPSNSDGSNVNYELGMRFTATSSGQIKAIRFYKSASETGTHIGKIYSSTGQLLVSVTFANETTSGWQVQNLANPLAIAANTEYTVTVNTGNTYYVASNYGFANQIINGSLRSVVGNNGVFGPVGVKPTQSWKSSNYFRDVVFVHP
jgi:hypothetical protein